MEIPATRLDRGFFKYQKEFEEAALRTLRSGWYILGKEVENFEVEFAKYAGVKHCVGLASGLDALWIAVKLLGIGEGDEVLVQGNTYIASVMGITMNGATPVFVEPDIYNNMDPSQIEEKITEKTKAIMVVHLYGQASDMDTIMDIAKRHNLKVIEDCAQSQGSCWKGKLTGTFGDVGCFSFYPSKNLGAFGDGGAVLINDDELDKKFRIFRNYGSEKRYYNCMVGANSRLDEIQAAMLRVRLSHLDEINDERKVLGERYTKGIDNPVIEKPATRDGADHIYHQYVVKCDHRDELISYLDSKGVKTLIHYPIPPHLSEAYASLGIKKGSLPLTEKHGESVLSLPMFTGLTFEEQDRVIDALNGFKR